MPDTQAGASAPDQTTGGDGFSASAYLKQLSTSTEQTARSVAASDKERVDTMRDFMLKNRQDAPPPEPPKAEPAPQQHDTPFLQAFGSPASALAVIGSLLTRRPLVSALNASSAAMQAIRQNDAASYDRAFKQWEKQTDYAYKTWQYQNERYRSILDNKRLSFEEMNAYLTAEAAANHDQILLQQLRAGNMQTAIDLIMKREQMAQQLDLAKMQLPPETKAVNAFVADYQKNNNGAYPPPDKMRDYIMSFQKKLTPQEQAMQMFIAQNPYATAEQARDFANSLQMRGVSGAMGMVNQLRADAIQKRIAEWKNAHPGEELDGKTQADIINDVMRPQLTGNARDRLEGDIDLIGFNMNSMDEALTTLDRHVMAAGLGGQAARLAEVAGNVLGGTTSTDYKQFQRTINYLKLNAPHILAQRSGRPMSQEEGKIDNIIAGLSLGDTTANTKRALDELKQLYTVERQRMIQRWNGTWTPQDLAAPAASPAAPATAVPAPGSPPPPPAAAPPKGSWRDEAIPAD